MDIQTGNNYNPFYLKCVNVDYSLLVLPPDGARLYGIFGFKVLYGLVDVNGYCYHGRKFDSKNFVYVSVPAFNVPVFMNVLPASTATEEVNVLTSRLRGLIDQHELVGKQLLARGGPVAIVLIHHKLDYLSTFISQQHPETIFRAPPNTTFTEIGRECFCIFNEPTGRSDLPRQLYSNEEYYWLCGILERIYRGLDNAGGGSNKSECGRVLLVGNKGVGKSTLLRYLINSLLSRINDTKSMKRIYLLDCDVGQSELTPSGLISLHEISEPLFNAPFAEQRRSLRDSFFFGSISPGVDFDLYKCLVRKCVRRYESLRSEDSILFINTVGWIEDLGYDLMCNLIRDVTPTLLISIRTDDSISFEVPANYRHIICKFKRSTMNSGVQLSRKKTPALLRTFLVAGYFAHCFEMRPATSVSRDELRLADVIPYRMRFASVGLYFHPELAPVADRLVLGALNCAVVALCSIDDNKSIERRRILVDDSLPERITAKLKSKDTVNDEDNNNPHRRTLLPILRCYGYGMIRAIDAERKIFYVLTPIEPSLLKSVNVFALGHELQATAILFDSKCLEQAPYLVELGTERPHNLQKLYSPLKNVTGVKRLMGRSGALGHSSGRFSQDPRFQDCTMTRNRSNSCGYPTNERGRKSARLSAPHRS